MSENNNELIQKVKQSLDRVRPYLQADGGDLEFIELTDDLYVKIKLTGTCTNCPFSAQTLKAGVEMTLKNDIPEVRGVLEA
ncbi:NifU family protein [Bacteroidota bacterium]